MLHNRMRALTCQTWFDVAELDDYVFSIDEICYWRDIESALLKHEISEDECEFIEFPLAKQYVIGLKYAWDCYGNCFTWKEVFQVK